MARLIAVVLSCAATSLAMLTYSVQAETPQAVKEISIVGPVDCTSGPGLR
jgi:hypothetical protein